METKKSSQKGFLGITEVKRRDYFQECVLSSGIES